MPYERRQNTDNYYVRIERVITEGEQLLRRIQIGNVNGFDEVTSAFNETSQWLSAGRDLIATLYRDPAVAGSVNNHSQLDLQNDSHLTIINGLRAEIEEQIGSLKEIRRQTRIHDGQPPL